MMIAKLPILGFTLVTALAGQAVAHEDCDHAPQPSTYRAPAPVQPSYSTPVGYPGHRGGRHAAEQQGYRADISELRQSDLNRDGWITLAEALRHGRRDFRRSDRDQNSVLSRWEVAQVDLAYDDRDRNGRISFDEHQAAIRRSFAHFDSNRDGLLASYELNGPVGHRAANWRR
jgi:hypothetical protein